MNILIIRTHRLGDILQLAPMIAGLKEIYPDSRIYFLTGDDFVSLLEGNTDIDFVIPIPEKEYRFTIKNEPEKYSRIFNEFYDLISDLRQTGFDIIINRQYEWGAILAHCIGAGEILGGSYSPERGLFFADPVSEDLFNLIRKDRRLNQLNLVNWACRIAGIPHGKFRPLCFPLSPAPRYHADRLIGKVTLPEDAGALIGIQMGAARSFRQWDIDNFSEIIRWLTEKKGRRVVLTGDEDEVGLVAQLSQRLNHKENLIDLVGKTSLKELGAVIEKCELFITGDTGPMHIAAAVGTPVLALFFGTAYPWETGPYGSGHFILYSNVPCAPCLDTVSCSSHVCKRALTPLLVMESFELFEKYQKNIPIVWPETGHSPVELFITFHDKAGEQLLIKPEAPECSSRLSSYRASGEERKLIVEEENLIEKGEEVVRSFLCGDGEKGFRLFSEYLHCLFALKNVVMEGTPGCDSIFNSLLQKCMAALKSRDTITLMDNVEYGFKPLLLNAAVLRK